MSICGKFCASHFHKMPLPVNELVTFIYSEERNIIMLLLLLTLPTSVVLPNIIANLSDRWRERGIVRYRVSSPAEHVFAAGHFRCRAI